jgi:hypothetical protein
MNNMDRWVDPRVAQVRTADVQRYLVARGWKPKPSPRPQLLMFEEPAGRERKPIIQTVPASERGSDYRDGIVRVITNLAVIEDRYAVDVLNDILRGQGGAEPNGAIRGRLKRKKVVGR